MKYSTLQLLVPIEQENNIKCRHPKMKRKRKVKTFIPTSIGGISTKGTSLVDISHKRIAKLHMSAERWSTSSGFLFKTKV